MKGFLKSVIYSLVRLKFNLSGRSIKVESQARIYPGSCLDGYNKLCKKSYLKGNIGRGSYIGANSIITGNIGQFCSIASNVSFITKTHPTSEFVSTSPAFYSLKRQNGLAFIKEQLFDEEPLLEGKDYSIEVGNDVYIGYGVTIIGPCKIGDGAIIAANSTVVKDVEPFTIVGGVPAKKIKMRFETDEIEFLQNLQWWNKDLQWLNEHASLFKSIKTMKNELQLEDS